MIGEIHRSGVGADEFGQQSCFADREGCRRIAVFEFLGATGFRPPLVGSDDEAVSRPFKGQA